MDSMYRRYTEWGSKTGRDCGIGLFMRWRVGGRHSCRYALPPFKSCEEHGIWSDPRSTVAVSRCCLRNELCEGNASGDAKGRDQSI